MPPYPFEGGTQPTSDMRSSALQPHADRVTFAMNRESGKGATAESLRPTVAVSTTSLNSFIDEIRGSCAKVLNSSRSPGPAFSSMEVQHATDTPPPPALSSSPFKSAANGLPPRTEAEEARSPSPRPPAMLVEGRRRGFRWGAGTRRFVTPSGTPAFKPVCLYRRRTGKARPLFRCTALRSLSSSSTSTFERSTSPLRLKEADARTSSLSPSLSPSPPSREASMGVVQSVGQRCHLTLLQKYVLPRGPPPLQLTARPGESVGRVSSSVSGGGRSPSPAPPLEETWERSLAVESRPTPAPSSSPANSRFTGEVSLLSSPTELSRAGPSSRRPPSYPCEEYEKVIQELQQRVEAAEAQRHYWCELAQRLQNENRLLHEALEKKVSGVGNAEARHESSTEDWELWKEVGEISLSTLSESSAHSADRGDQLQTAPMSPRSETASAPLESIPCNLMPSATKREELERRDSLQTRSERVRTASAEGEAAGAGFIRRIGPNSPLSLRWQPHHRNVPLR